MSTKEFVDYYEILQVSPKASSTTIERVFRFLAKDHHPDVSDQNDIVHFTRLVEAFDTLRDPERRTDYDVLH